METVDIFISDSGESWLMEVVSVSLRAHTHAIADATEEIDIGPTDTGADEFIGSRCGW
jgi:hypothetical protein